MSQGTANALSLLAAAIAGSALFIVAATLFLGGEVNGTQYVSYFEELSATMHR